MKWPRAPVGIHIAVIVGTVLLCSAQAATPPLQDKAYQGLMEAISRFGLSIVEIVEESGDTGIVGSLTTVITPMQNEVSTLVEAVRGTADRSKDAVLLADLPSIIDAVESASADLTSADGALRQNPSSATGKQLAISSTQGMVKGTADLLNAVDQSEVRKIVTRCQALQEVVAMSDAVESPADKTTFGNDLTTIITDLTKNMLEPRSASLANLADSEDLTHLSNYLEQFMTNLFSVVDLYVTINSNGGSGLEVARESVKLTSNTLSRILDNIIAVVQKSALADAAMGDGFSLTTKDMLDMGKAWEAHPTIRSSALELVTWGRFVATSLTGSDQSALISLCDQTDDLTQAIEDCLASPDKHSTTLGCRNNGGDLLYNLNRLRAAIDTEVTTVVVDVGQPWKARSLNVQKAAKVSTGIASRIEDFESVANQFVEDVNKLADASVLVGNSTSFIKGSQELRDYAAALIGAAECLLLNPGMASASTYLDQVRAGYDEKKASLISLIDETIDVVSFLTVSLAALGSDEDDVMRAGDDLDATLNVATLNVLGHIDRVRALTLDKALTDAFLYDDVSEITATMGREASKASSVIRFSRPLDNWFGAVNEIKSIVQELLDLFQGVSDDENTFAQSWTSSTDRPTISSEQGSVGSHPILQAARDLYVASAYWSNADNAYIDWADQIVQLLTGLDSLVSDDVTGSATLIDRTVKQIQTQMDNIVYTAREGLSRTYTTRVAVARLSAMNVQLPVTAQYSVVMRGALDSDEEAAATESLVTLIQCMVYATRCTLIRIPYVDSGWTWEYSNNILFK